MDYCDDYMDCGLSAEQLELAKDDLSDMTVFMANYPKDVLRQMMMMRSNRKSLMIFHVTPVNSLCSQV